MTSAVSVTLIRHMLWKMLGADHPMEAHKIDSRGVYHRGRSADALKASSPFFKSARLFSWQGLKGSTRVLPLVGRTHLRVVETVTPEPLLRSGRQTTVPKTRRSATCLGSIGSFSSATAIATPTERIGSGTHRLARSTIKGASLHSDFFVNIFQPSSAQRNSKRRRPLQRSRLDGPFACAHQKQPQDANAAICRALHPIDD